MRKILGILALAFSLTISVSAHADNNDSPLAEIGFVSMDNLSKLTSGINNIRLAALRETAMTVGAQGALAWRAIHIDQALQQESNYLDNIFDFNQLLLNHDVLPPVLSEADDSLNLDNDDTIRLADHTYQIVSPARFVTAAPTWRTYLWLDYKKPSMPDTSLLPKNKAEAQVWNYYLRQGWQQGLVQANEIFSDNLNRLKRDFTGMVLYRKLLAQNMVSSPYVAQTNLGVTGNANHLSIGDRILRITAQSKLQTNASKWSPVLTNPSQQS